MVGKRNNLLDERLNSQKTKKAIFWISTVFVCLLLILSMVLFPGTFLDYSFEEPHKSYSTRLSMSEGNFTADIYLKFEVEATDFWAEEIVHVTVGIESKEELVGGSILFPKTNLCLPAEEGWEPIPYTRGNIGLSRNISEEDYHYPLNRSNMIGENLVYFPHGGDYNIEITIQSMVNTSQPTSYTFMREDIISIASTSEKRMYELTRVGTFISGLGIVATFTVVFHKLKKVYDWSHNG